METKHIRISDFNYQLPDERIAKFPVTQRDHSKLLIYNKGEISENHFYNLSDYIPKGSLMVFNNTKVIQARIHFFKETGASIEVFLLEPESASDYEQMFQARGKCSWVCLVGNLKKWKGGLLYGTFICNNQKITVSSELKGTKGTGYVVEFKWDPDISFAELIDCAGELPIPPYLNRETQESDKQTYQTVYSKIKGSVAAPTAGLHFTKNVLDSLDANGIEREELTLHVGAGTFKPVKSEEIEGHEMHTETFFVQRKTIEKLLSHDCEAIAVGTTSVRTLESLYYIGLKLACNASDNPHKFFHVNQWEPYETDDNKISPTCAMKSILDYMNENNLDAIHGSTQIIIAPGYKYKIVKKLITNFHQPQSTLLLLVSAFVNGDWKRIYDYALAHDFRFLSYGDSSFLMP